MTNQVAALTWNAIAGQTYRLQYKDALSTNDWQDASPDVLASGPRGVVTQAIGSASARFYRVILVP